MLMEESLNNSALSGAINNLSNIIETDSNFNTSLSPGPIATSIARREQQFSQTMGLIGQLRDIASEITKIAHEDDDFFFNEIPEDI